jgi:hypothetical protein
MRRQVGPASLLDRNLSVGSADARTVIAFSLRAKLGPAFSR